MMNQMKNQSSDFFEFHFSSYRENTSKIGNSFDYKNNHNSKNKNQENWEVDIEFVSTHSTSFL